MKTKKTSNLLPFVPKLDSWEVEKCYQDYTEILPALLRHIDQAQESIDLSMYIFTLDDVGNQVLDSLKNAAKRGVKVRLIVDGIGSPNFTSGILKQLYLEHKVEVRIYKPTSLFFRNFFNHLMNLRIVKIIKSIRKMNHRNHQKIGIFDSQNMIIGSANLNSRFAAWRETMISVKGKDIQFVQKDFNYLWSRSSTLNAYHGGAYRKQSKLSPYLIINNLHMARTRVKMINKAKNNLKLISPYFIPPYYLLIPLLRAARRGVQVEILTSKKTDVWYIPWFSRRYFNLLIKNNIKIHEHPTLFMHTKTMIADNKAMVGSSNLNYRSFHFDLELDIIVSHPETIAKLNDYWEKDINDSTVLTKVSNHKLWVKFLNWLKPIRKIS